MSNEMAVDLEAIQVLFDNVDNERANIYDAIDKIRNEISWATEQSNMWRGADADAFKESMNTNLAQVYSITKWLNRITYELKVYAEKLKEEEQARAEKINSSMDI